MERKYRCRKCRHVLLTSDVVIERCCTASNQCPLVYVDEDQMPEWISEAVNEAGWTKGKLNCGLCHGRVGSFDFVRPLTCGCHDNHTLPPIRILRSRVDVNQNTTSITRLHPWQEQSRNYSNHHQSNIETTNHTEVIDNDVNIHGVSENQEVISDVAESFEDRDVLVEPMTTSDVFVEPPRDVDSDVIEGLVSTDTSSSDSDTIEHAHDNTVVQDSIVIENYDRWSGLGIGQNKHTNRWQVFQTTDPDCHDSHTDTSSDDEDLYRDFPLRSDVSKDSYTCPICFDVYYRPQKCLPCHHTFCDVCIRMVVKHNATINIQCPLCRKEVVHCTFNKVMEESVRYLFPKEYQQRKKTENTLSRKLRLFPLPRCSIKDVPILLRGTQQTTFISRLRTLPVVYLLLFISLLVVCSIVTIAAYYGVVQTFGICIYVLKSFNDILPTFPIEARQQAYISNYIIVCIVASITFIYIIRKLRR